MDKRLLTGLLVMGLLIVGGCVALVWRSGDEPPPAPHAASFLSDVARLRHLPVQLPAILAVLASASPR